MKKKYIKYLFILPCIVYLLGFSVYPLIYSLYLSFHSWELGRVDGRMQFWGLKNFRRIIFEDSRFWNDLRVTFSYVVLAVPLEFLIGFGMALLLNREIRGARFFKAFFMIPIAMSSIAVGYIWRMMLQESIGPINYLMGLVGLPRVAWLTSIDVALYTVISVGVWQWWPFNFIVLLAALQSLPNTPYEAAVLDGASRLQVFRHITLPLLRPPIATILLLRVVEAFKVFDHIVALTYGTPGISTESLSLYIYYRGLKLFSLGYASAISYVLNIILIIISLLLVRRLYEAGG